MARVVDRTELLKMLAQSVISEDPMLELIKNLLGILMDAEVDVIVGADRSERTTTRKQYRSGYRTRRFDIKEGSMMLNIPKLRKGGYVPGFMERGQRCEEALKAAVAEAYVKGISTRKMDDLVHALGIDGISKSQVSNMSMRLNAEAEAFRNRSLSDNYYPILIVDALYEKVRVDHCIQSTAIMVVAAIDDEGKRHVIAIEAMPDESNPSYSWLFRSLKERGLRSPKLVISDAAKGLTSAIVEEFPGARWQRCKVHFMRNILAHVSKKGKEDFSNDLKGIWNAPNKKTALLRAKEIVEKYQNRYPKAVKCLEEGLEETFTFFEFSEIDPRKISSSNMLERLNREFRRRSKVVSVFTNTDAYLRLLTSYIIDYTDSWSQTGRAYILANSLEKYLT